MANQPASNTQVNRIQNRITGTDKSKAAFTSVASSMRKVAGAALSLRGRLRDLTIIGGGVVAIFKALGAAVKNSSKTVVDMELAEKRLEFTLKKTGQFSEATKQSMLGLAESMQFTTRFTAATVLEMEQLLLSMGQVAANEIPEVTEALLSYVDVYKGGQGAIEITRQFARHVGGAGGDVGEMGIQVGDAKTNVEKLANAMEQLKAKFGGAAKFLAETAAGRFSIFQNVIGQVVTNMGMALIQAPSFQNAMEAIVTVIERLGFASVGVDNLNTTMVDFFDKLIAAAIQIGIALATAFIAIIPVVIRLAILIVDLLGQAIEFLAAQFFEWFKQLGPARKALEAFGSVGESVSDTMLELANAFGTFGNILAESVSVLGARGGPLGGGPGATLGTELEDSLLGLRDALKEAIKLYQELQIRGPKAFAEMRNELENLKDGTDGTVRVLVEVKSAVEDVKRAWINFAVEAFDDTIGLNEAWSNLGDSLRNSMIASFADLSLGALFSRQVEIRGEAGNLIGFEDQLGPIGEMVELISAPFRAIGDSIADAVGEANLLGDTGVAVADALKARFEPLGQVLGAIFKPIISVLGTVLDLTIGWLVETLAKALATLLGIDLGTKATQASQVATALAASAVITTAISSQAAALAVAWTPAATLAAIATFGAALAFGALVPGIVGANMTAITAIGATTAAATGAAAVTGLAHGGIATRPTLANIAEGGKAEAVIPLEGARADRFFDRFTERGGGGSTTINIESLTVRSRRDITDLVDEISRRLGLELEDSVGFGTTGGGRGS